MLTVIYFIIIILVIISLFVFGKKIPFLSSKITLSVLLVILLISSILFIKVVRKVNNSSYKSQTKTSATVVEQTELDIQHYKNKTTIYVGTTAKIIPWSYVKQGKINGFNVELIKEAVKLMAKKIEIKVYPNTQKLYEALDNRTIDIIIDWETKDNNKTSQYGYSISLVSQPLVFIGQQGSFKVDTTAKELIIPSLVQNKTIVVADILMLTRFLKNHIDITNINKLPNNNDVILTVSKNKNTIGFTEYYAFLNYKRNNPKTNLVIISSLLNNELNKPQSFVLNKDDFELINQLNIALNVLKRRGKISNLSMKYFNEDVTL